MPCSAGAQFSPVPIRYGARYLTPRRRCLCCSHPACSVANERILPMQQEASSSLPFPADHQTHRHLEPVSRPASLRLKLYSECAITLMHSFISDPCGAAAVRCRCLLGCHSCPRLTRSSCGPRRCLMCLEMLRRW